MLNVYVFQLAKNGTLVGLFCFSLYFLQAINRVNLAFRTTIIEDTHLTLTVIPFKVEANNSLTFLPLQTYEKKFAEFLFLLVYNFLPHPDHHGVVRGSGERANLLMYRSDIQQT